MSPERALAENLITLRHGYDLSLKAVGNRIGTSHSTVLRIERMPFHGAYNPSFGVVARLANAFFLTPRWIVMQAPDFPQRMRHDADLMGTYEENARAAREALDDIDPGPALSRGLIAAAQLESTIAARKVAQAHTDIL